MGREPVWQPYRVALVLRGTGGSHYTWLGPPGLSTGFLVAVQFRQALELGVVVGPDASHDGRPLLPLWPLNAPGAEGWGGLLLSLSRLCCSLPDEVAPFLLLDSATKSLQLSLSITEPQRLSAEAMAEAGPLCGHLTPSRRKALAKLASWMELTELASQGPASPLSLCLDLVGAARQVKPGWGKYYRLDEASARLLGLDPQRDAWPGHFLAGLVEGPRLKDLPILGSRPRDTATRSLQGPASIGLDGEWEELRLDSAWDLCRRIPGLECIRMKRLQTSWPALCGGTSALARFLGKQIELGQRVLLLAPQTWMLDRLWPALAPWAGQAIRHMPEQGGGASRSCLRLAAKGPSLLAGGPGAWKFAAHIGFDLAVVIDPTHPQYAQGHSPSLDPRIALLAAMALAQERAVAAQVLFIEFGLGCFDGSSGGRSVNVCPPHSPIVNSEAPSPGSLSDTDPLPLHLRQPGVRRLIYFNRLGSAQGLICAECEAWAHCPNCKHQQLRYSLVEKRYTCGGCGWYAEHMRCRRCGLGSFTAISPGIEAVAPRAGDVMVCAATHKPVGAHTERVLGTASLLDEEAAFWPEEIVFVQSSTGAAFESWPSAVDSALRLSALYRNPELRSVHAVGQRLADELGIDNSRSRGAELGPGELLRRWELIMRVRRLADLPPFGCFYEIHAQAKHETHAVLAREWLGEQLKAKPGTVLLRLGKPYFQRGMTRFGGQFINSEASYDWLQDLRVRLRQQHVGLRFVPRFAPWAIHL